MSDTDFEIKHGDTSPALEAQLMDGTQPVDLTNATAVFKMQPVSTGTAVEGLCSITDPDNGELAYSWTSGDTDATGLYEAEFRLDYDSPTSLEEFDGDETFPPESFLTIRVTETL